MVIGLQQHFTENQLLWNAGACNESDWGGLDCQIDAAIFAFSHLFGFSMIFNYLGMQGL